ncbi:NUDIX hydrolase [Nocardioides bizhenqiangii]|uniref:NUDIX hydrolase n=1 Tax=Nocardioides bizhenqiangii TaxID=3095076 RepID=A0ABZ0ZW27_9ACTN|nr:MULTISPECIES: NUDIX hydrolase [unclassified Nocardioides]MDZ5623171.1 NUDIX hydrolase [Nocardioides sp. HM23]WQQ28144.1 NUDIX hydrolase [Nocardioides sp. HM61]
MPDQPDTHVATVSDGVARIHWSTMLTERGWQAAVDVVRRDVAAALVDHDRVEALVPVDDDQGQRIATWSGLRREGVQRQPGGDVVVYARLVDDVPVHEPGGFRALLNSFLPRKRAISQMLIRDTSPEPRVLLCQLTYKNDWDLPGGVVEVGESPQLAVVREVEEELGLDISAGPLVLTDWLPPWGGWDDALCLVFDGGAHDASLVERIVPQAREIRSAEFCTLAEVDERAADFSARRIRAAVANLGGGPAYTESGR